MRLEERLTALRKEQGLSQLELAEKLDVSRQSVSKWETGTAVPSMDNMRTLSQLYEVPIDYLMGDGERPARAEGENPAGTQAGKGSRRTKRYIEAAVLVLVLAIGIGAWVLSRGEEVHDLGELKREEVMSDSSFSVDW